MIDLAGFIDAWRAEYDVTRSGAPRISLALKIFNGGGATRQPILSLADLYLDATLVPPKKPD